MKTLQDVLTAQLAETPVSLERFGGVVARLYATGVLLREESSSETRLYDDALRIVHVLNDYFALAGFRLVHNAQFNYFRLYPPTAQDGDEDPAKRLRARLTKYFAAYVLVLRDLYTSARDAGNLNEILEHPVPLQDVHLGMARLLRLQKPALKRERTEIYEELRVQKLVRLPEGYRDEADDMMVSIRPGVLDFVSDAQLAAIRTDALAHAPRTEAPGDSATLELAA